MTTHLQLLKELSTTAVLLVFFNAEDGSALKDVATINNENNEVNNEVECGDDYKGACNHAAVDKKNDDNTNDNNSIYSSMIKNFNNRNRELIGKVLDESGSALQIQENFHEEAATKYLYLHFMHNGDKKSINKASDKSVSALSGSALMNRSAHAMKVLPNLLIFIARILKIKNESLDEASVECPIASNSPNYNRTQNKEAAPISLIGYESNKYGANT